MWTAQALSSAYFGQGNGPIFLDNVACSGTEITLLSCNSSKIGSYNCSHYEDAGVSCSGTYCSLNSATVSNCKNFQLYELPTKHSNILTWINLWATKKWRTIWNGAALQWQIMNDAQILINWGSVLVKEICLLLIQCVGRKITVSSVRLQLTSILTVTIDCVQQ